jgi:hypothetical protein
LLEQRQCRGQMTPAGAVAGLARILRRRSIGMAP